MTKTRNIVFWALIIVAFFIFLYLIRSILLPFVLGMAIAYFLDPAADRLQRMKCSRTSATMLIIGSFFSLIALVLILGVPILAGQLSEFITTLPSYFQQLEQNFIPYMKEKLGILSPELVASLKDSITSSTGIIATATTNFFSNALTSGMAFINVISLILITPIVAFYFLRDWDRIVDHVNALLPRSHAETIREQLHIIDQTLAGFVRGQLTVCFLLGLYYAIGLSIAGLNFGFVIGLTTGFLAIFPYVGLIVGMGIGLMVAVFQFSDMSSVMIVLGVFVSGQFIEGNFVTPKLVGDKVGLHPAWVIFAMLSGAALFGFVGVLLAIPVAAVLGVLIRFSLMRYQQSEYSQ